MLVYSFRMQYFSIRILSHRLIRGSIFRFKKEVLGIKFEIGILRNKIRTLNLCNYNPNKHNPSVDLYYWLKSLCSASAVLTNQARCNKNNLCF